MKKRVFSLVTLFVIFLSITSCQKKDDLLYSTVGSIDKVTILDIEPMGDNYTWMVLAIHKVFVHGQSFNYNYLYCL